MFKKIADAMARRLACAAAKIQEENNCHDRCNRQRQHDEYDQPMPD